MICCPKFQGNGGEEKFSLTSLGPWLGLKIELNKDRWTGEKEYKFIEFIYIYIYTGEPSQNHEDLGNDQNRKLLDKETIDLWRIARQKGLGGGSQGEEVTGHWGLFIWTSWPQIPSLWWECLPSSWYREGTFHIGDLCSVSGKKGGVGEAKWVSCLCLF